MLPPSPALCHGAQLVLQAARALFGEHGVDAVSIQDIAKRAGVSKANVFHHFASKEDLYVAVMRDALPDESDLFSRHAASPAPFAERLTALLEEHLAGMIRDPEGMQLVMREMTGGNVERARLLATQLFADRVRQKIQFFEDARQRGELAPSVSSSEASMLLGACASFYFNCRETSCHLQEVTGLPSLGTPADFAQRMVPLLLNGLAAPAPVARPRAKSKTPTKTPSKIPRQVKP